jgi:CheY-like chemotaxis protein
LQEGSDQTQTERALAIIERNARAQATLIDDVLDVARVVSGKLALHIAPTSLVVAARAAIETVAPAANAKDITIVTEISEDMPTVMADAHRLQQVIWNLLSNAVKFTPKGGRVSLRTYRDDSDVCVSVQDNGEGIDPALLDAVFDPFRQADASTTRRHGGLGLGLSIVKHLVVSHGGSVHAHSDGPGHGSTFTVRMPVSALATARRKQQSSVSGDAQPSDPGPITRLDGLHVLVVDDEADSRSLVEAILRKQGAQVEVVASAAEARRCFNSSLPDVIVSDIGMPGEDGYSFMRSARARGVVAPAVALTAYASQQDAERAFLAGFQRHVAKPVEPRALVQTVAALGGRSV